jgi:hypothetical protein
MMVIFRQALIAVAVAALTVAVVEFVRWETTTEPSGVSDTEMTR